jgi:hypothetical protein
MTRHALILALCLVAALPLPSRAVSCHCFQDRDYDPAAPGKADEYVLATARNSLLAGAFGMEKGDVVRARMGGASEADLWIAYQAKATTGADPDRLLEARGQSASWAEALKNLGIAPEALGKPFASALAAGKTDEQAAQFLADPFLSELPASGGEAAVKALRDAGADTAEAAVALLLQTLVNRPAVEFLKNVRMGTATWGTLLNNAGVTPQRAGKLIASKMLI